MGDLQLPVWIQIAVALITAGVSGLVVFAVKVEGRISRIEGYLAARFHDDERRASGSWLDNPHGD